MLFIIRIIIAIITIIIIIIIITYIEQKIIEYKTELIYCPSSKVQQGLVKNDIQRARFRICTISLILI